MSVIEIVGGILIILFSVFICIFVMMQEGSRGGGGIAALSGGDTDSFLNKNPGRTRDRLLYRATRFLAIAFFVLTIIVHAVNVR